MCCIANSQTCPRNIVRNVISDTYTYRRIKNTGASRGKVGSSQGGSSTHGLRRVAHRLTDANTVVIAAAAAGDEGEVWRWAPAETHVYG